MVGLTPLSLNSTIPHPLSTHNQPPLTRLERRIPNSPTHTPLRPQCISLHQSKNTYLPPRNTSAPLTKSSWQHKVLGYYAFSQATIIPPSAVPWSLLRHVILAFGTLDSSYNVTILTKFQSVASDLFATAARNGVKPVLSIGGYGAGSHYFSEMVKGNSNWEYPGRQSFAGIPYSTHDVPNLLLLLQELRSALDTDVTISAALSSTYPWSAKLADFAKILDWGSLMDYNFVGAKSKMTGSASPLTGGASGGTINVEEGAKKWNDSGLPYEKLILGIPGYGRAWILSDRTSPTKNGISNTVTSVPTSDSGQTSQTGVWRFRNILSQTVLSPSAADSGVYVGGSGWTPRFDNGTKPRYVWNNSTGEFISYDDPVSVSYKREYAAGKGMAGMMIWQVGYDVVRGELWKYTN